VRLTGLLFLAAFLPAPALAQLPEDTLRRGVPSLRATFPRDSLTLPQPAPLSAFGRFAPVRLPAELIVEETEASVRRSAEVRRRQLWSSVVRSAHVDPWRERRMAGLLAPDTTPAPLAPGANGGTDLLSQHTDLGLEFRARIESKTEANRNERCLESDFLNPFANCRGTIQPRFDFQFGVRSGGSIADRVSVNVDYDSQREFEASNNVGVRYDGRSHEIVQLVEFGNVSFNPPASQFITAGIPSGNYGMQAVGQLGPMRFQTIYAEQKGNVVRDRIFTIGERAEQLVEREIEDHQMERRRFFWVVDPAIAFPSIYPNVDILDPALASRLELPPGERPQRVLVYRYRPPSAAGITVRDVNGPVAHVRFARNQNAIGPFEVLQQGVDYYIDPSNLWITLVTPISRTERLAVSYTVPGPGGAEVVRGDIGGTFPTVRRPWVSDTLNLLWDPEILPTDAAFNREIRSVYRLGGETLRRETVQLRVVVGSGGDQEKPVSERADSYLELFGLAHPTSRTRFDVENRLWPREGDPNIALNAGGTMARLLRDQFVIFPSLRPFGSDGLVSPPDPVNDSLYRTADEDLVSQRRPPTRYRLRVRFQTQGGGSANGLMLGAVQLRPGSERVHLDGVELRRGLDYTIDYDVGRVSFSRPDTLFSRERQVSVQYEENPFFIAAPTAILGIATVFPLEQGQIGITALTQTQKSTFNRPPLGFEPVSSAVAGITTNLSFDSEGLTRALNRLPFVESSATSSINVQGEFATSRPQSYGSGAAYLETFESEGGIVVPLLEGSWRTGSQPAITGSGPVIAGTPYDFAIDSAATLAWQNVGTVRDPVTNTFRFTQLYTEQIDTLFVFTGGQNFRSPETVLWHTLYPSNVAGQLRGVGGALWRLPGTGGRRWRSISQSLSPGGVDLTRIEHVEFWALVDTTFTGRTLNPTLVADFGDISENSVAFAPVTLTLQRRTVIVEGVPTQVVDSTYTGRRLAGYDSLHTERDPITRSFDATRDDRGLPGDLLDTLIRVDLDAGTVDTLLNVPMCNRAEQTVYPIGDAAANCTRGNRRLDEEDLDLDGFLNLSSDMRNAERLRRFVIDMSNPGNFDRIGRCYRSVHDTTTVLGPRPVCWVRFRLPFNSPQEELNAPLIRRTKSVRLTLVSAPNMPNDAYTTVPIARLRLIGSPWVKRSDRPILGVAGSVEEGSGFVIASVIGTQDRNPAGGIFYESPPGVTDEADSKQSDFAPGQVQVNERSLRLQAGELPLYGRAEAYYRFPQGEKNFMGYRELRVWARGRGSGWGEEGDLQFFVKLGQDVENFYLYRTSAQSGNTRDAWLPEVRVDFARFFALRAQLQNAWLQNGPRIACTGADSALVAASIVPVAGGGQPYAACADGYIVYSANPGINPPNLAAVQELAVGMIRTDALGAGGGIMPTDTLELWVNDIRLTGMEQETGYAGHLGLSVIAGDLGTLQLSATRRDGNFRQLGEMPSFVTSDQISVSSAVRLDRFLPQGLGLLMPFSVSHVRAASDPYYLSRTDLSATGLPGLRTPRAHATSYTLSARRATPIDHNVLGALVNNLAFNTAYSTAASRSEYQTGQSSAFSGSLDYNLVPQGRQTGTPRWLQRVIDGLPAFLRETEGMRSLRNSQFRLNPAQLRITTGYARTTDRRSAFSLPIASAEDTAFVMHGLTSIWRNAASLEMRPVNSLSGRVDVVSLRDMRDYGDTTDLGLVARNERGRLLGMDAGLERERRISTAIGAAPAVTSWLRPRFDYTTSFSMLRDPNFMRLVADSLGVLHLPRRFLNSQGVGAAATFDIGRAIQLVGGNDELLGVLARSLRPVDVAWRRDYRSTFDGVAFDAPLGYQLGRGGLTAFRSQNGVPATAAGASRSLTVSHAIALPFGLTLVDRYTRATTTSWARVVSGQTRLDAEQTVFPDMSLRWSLRPAATARIFSSIGGQVGIRVTRGSTFQPTLSDGSELSLPGVRYEQTIRQYPVTANAVWDILGGFSTGLGYNRTDRREVRSGGVIRSDQDDLSAEVGKNIPLPASWQIRGQMLRTRLGVQQSQNRTIFVVGGTERRATDNGRWSVNANADSDISETLSFTMTLARIINYDNINDRRFSQTVFSVVMHLSFFAGVLP
jgi:hypothetical protein